VNRKVAETGNFIEVASSANDGPQAQADPSLRIALTPGEDFQEALLSLKDAAALERDAAAR